MSVSKDIPWLHDLKAEAVKSFAVMNKRNIVFFWVTALQRREMILAKMNGTLI